MSVINDPRVLADPYFWMTCILIGLIVLLSISIRKYFGGNNHDRK